MKQTIILDSNPGPHDTSINQLAAHHPALGLPAIPTVAGNPVVSMTARKAHTVSFLKVSILRIPAFLVILLVFAGLLFSPLQSSSHSTIHVKTHTDAAGNWLTYLWDNARSNDNSHETLLNPGNASHLKLHWHHSGAGPLNTQPIVVNGVIYWGAWDGYERASNLHGKVLWRTYLGITSSCSPHEAGVASTATIGTITLNGQPTEVVLVGGGDAHFYALNAANGQIIWSTQLGLSPQSMIWDAPAVYNGSVYIGTSSYGDCPLIQGQLVQMDETTGTIQHIFSGTIRCSGGGVWASPTIDEANNTVYIATGNGKCKTAFALVALRATDLSVISSWQIPANKRDKDTDFGSTPTLFEATINGTIHQMVGVMHKGGIYFAFDRSNISAGPIWHDQISNNGGGNISSSAWDGTTLYVAGAATTINGQSCPGSVRALDPATGTYLWQYCAPGKIIPAVTLVPGLVIVAAHTYLIVLDATSVQPLFQYQDPREKSDFWGAASVSNGVLYIGNRDGNLYAFGQ